MAEEYLDMMETCRQLQISQDKVLQLLKSGELDAEEIDGEMRFTASSIAAYKNKIAGGETVIEGGKAKPAFDELVLEEEGGVNLADIESEPGADESDQTSVLKPVGEAEKEEAREEEPVFKFEEDDSTSYMDKGAGEDLETVKLSDEDETDSGMVADLLKPEAGAGEVDDSLETVDLAELEGGTEGISADTDTVPTEGSSAETRLVEEGAVDIGDEETIGLDSIESDTEDIGGALLDVGEEGIEEAGARPLAGIRPAQMGPAVVGDMVRVQVSAAANACLSISMFLVLFAGFMLLCAGLGFYHNPVARWVFDTVRDLFFA